MDGIQLTKPTINFIFDFKTPNGFLPLGYNKYSLPINFYSALENIYSEKYTSVVTTMNSPTKYTPHTAAYQTKLLERGKKIRTILSNELIDEEHKNTINPNDIYLLCFESFGAQVLFEYYGNILNQLDNMISPKMIDLLKKYENIKILFIDIWEGSYEHDYRLFNNINDFLNKHNINHTNKVIVSSNNVLMEELDFNKINKTPIKRIHTFNNDHYINEAGKFISQLRVENNEIIEDNYNYSIQSQLNFSEKPKKFLCYNRNTSRMHRPYFVGKLWENNLLDSGYVSLIQNDDFDEQIKKTSDEIGELDIRKNQYSFLVNNYKNFYPLSIDESDGERVAWFHNYLSRKKEYEETFFSIVAETNAEKRFLFITEKTMKPIMNLHPFFIVGNPNTLKYLKRIGFKTFSDFWDESYDSELNFPKRCDMIINEVKQLCNKPQSELIQMLKDMEEILIHNKKLLHSFWTSNRTEKLLINNIL